MKCRVRLTSLAAMVLFALSLPMAAPAQMNHDHGGGGMPMQHETRPDAAAPETPPADPFAAAMSRMHRDMMQTPTGDIDVDFVRAMIPHHQGAIDMARVVLASGHDPEIRRLAEQIIRSQEQEVAEFQAWLRQHPPQAQ